MITKGKRFVVCFFKAICVALVSIFAWFFVFLAKSFNFFSVSVFLAHLPGCGYLRYFFYRRTMKSVGKEVYFCYGSVFSYQDISIGNNVRIGYGTNVGLVDIGDDVLIGPYCSLLSGGKMHGIERTDIPIRLQPGHLQRVEIGKDCWLGASAVVMADIGEGCVVGSGAVVTKPIPPWSVVAGNPAKVIRSRK